MSKQNEPKRIDFVIPTIFAFIAGCVAVFVVLPVALQNVRLPFLYQTDSTHLAVLGCIIELPHNIPGLLIAICYFLGTLAITSAFSMLLMSAWFRLCDWSTNVVDEFCEGSETRLVNTDTPTEVSKPIEDSTAESAQEHESETLKMPESKALHGDPNSL